MIESAYYFSPVGNLKISAKNDMICEIKFCDDDEGLTVENIMEDHLPPILNVCTIQLREYFDGIRKNFDLLISQAGTEFQQSVWKQLLNIPYGATISYLQLSKNLGNEKAIRAAAASNGKNRIAIIVPCHRVIGSNHEMVGYAGGISRKKWLLQHEAKYTHNIQTLF